jgi:hypothetical protein
MIERTKVEISLLYPIEEALDAVIMTKVYKKMGFVISDFEPATAQKKGYYIMKMECDGLDNIIFNQN